MSEATKDGMAGRGGWTRREFLAAAGAGAGMLTLGIDCGGGGGSGSGSGGGSAGTTPKGSITVWTWTGPSPGLKAVLPYFYKQYPQVSVTVQDVGNPAIWDKITTAMAAGGQGLADVLHIGIDYLPSYTEKFPHGLADLSALGADKYKDAFAGGLWGSVTRNGRAYALPWEANAAGFYYRKDFFDKAGVQPESATTWDQMIEMGTAVKKATGAGLIGINKSATQADSANFFQMLLQLQGTFYFDPAGNITLSSPQAVAAMTLIKRLNDAGVVTDVSGGTPVNTAAFKGGQIAVSPNPGWWTGWAKQNLPDQAGNWQVMLPPAVKAGGSRAAIVNSSNLAISGTSQNQAAAWAFVEFVLTNAHSQVVSYIASGLYPALLAAHDDPAFSAPDPYFRGQKVQEVFDGELKDNRGVSNYSADYARALKLVDDAQTQVLLRGADPRAVLESAAQQLANQTGRKIKQ
jgi:lactose/L-arabinose transport system substrate-binding protein